MCRCTHVVVFDTTFSDLPVLFSSYPQVRIVRDTWLESCIYSRSYVDETPFLMKPYSEGNGSEQEQSIESTNTDIPATPFGVEWEHDVHNSVNLLLDRSETDYHHLFDVYSFGN